MSCKVNIKAPFICKEALVEALKRQVKDVRAREKEISFSIENVKGTHHFVYENLKWNLRYDDWERKGNGESLGQQLIDSLMPIYEEEYQAFQIREAARLEAERKAYQEAQIARIEAEAKKKNYVVHRYNQGKEVKLVLEKHAQAV